LRKHPWIFSGAISKVEGAPQPGDTVDIISYQGTNLGKGAYSPRSQISVRMWTFHPNENISEQFFRKKLERSFFLRKNFLNHGDLNKTACRLVYGESDGLPGLILDKYGSFIVGQFLSTGTEKWKSVLINLIIELLNPSGIYERSDVDVRLKEGLKKQIGVLYGQSPPDELEIEEDSLKFLVDIKKGQKTGFYLDQRINRSRISAYSSNAEVLNCFSYTGGFAIYALKSGAHRVINIDSSEEVLKLGNKISSLNRIPPGKMENIKGDVFKVLREFREEKRKFDLIILDPPKFADSHKHLQKASRGYKDINLLAFRLLRPGGILFTFSCSGLIPMDLFQKIVADAALDAGCNAQIIERLYQSTDHPTALNFPEGSYLKGLICRVIHSRENE
ncbi:MAG: class I SAM-dependent methyltransferase, partial [Calditrichota bacterium]